MLVFRQAVATISNYGTGISSERFAGDGGRRGMRLNGHNPGGSCEAAVLGTLDSASVTTFAVTGGGQGNPACSFGTCRP